VTSPGSSRTGSSQGNATGTSLRSSPLNRYGSTLREGSDTSNPKGSHWSFLLLLLPVLCCGGPFLILALAAAGTMALGVTAGIVAALIAIVALVIIRRRRGANCCDMPIVKGRP
jgi:hypothetical protein